MMSWPETRWRTCPKPLVSLRQMRNSGVWSTTAGPFPYGKSLAPPECDPAHSRAKRACTCADERRRAPSMRVLWRARAPAQVPAPSAALTHAPMSAPRAPVLAFVRAFWTG
jgi:hypothetical protein